MINKIESRLIARFPEKTSKRGVRFINGVSVGYRNSPSLLKSFLRQNLVVSGGSRCPYRWPLPMEISSTTGRRGYVSIDPKSAVETQTPLAARKTNRGACEADALLCEAEVVARIPSRLPRTHRALSRSTGTVTRCLTCRDVEPRNTSARKPCPCVLIATRSQPFCSIHFTISFAGLP